MNAISKIVFILFAYIFAEIYVFVEASRMVGFFNALFLLFLFSLAGYAITKIVKGASFNAAMADFADGKSPSRNLVKSAAYFIAGVLFLVPGFISDVIAAFFLIPFLNLYLIYLVLKYFRNKFKGNFSFFRGNWDYMKNSPPEGFYGKDITFPSLPRGNGEEN